MNPPTYVMMGGCTALRLRFTNGEPHDYYRDAGDWSVEFNVVDGQLVSWAPWDEEGWLHLVPLVEITEEEWRNNNKRYVL